MAPRAAREAERAMQHRHTSGKDMTSPNAPTTAGTQMGAPTQGQSQQQAGQTDRPAQPQAQQPAAPRFTDWASI